MSGLFYIETYGCQMNKYDSELIVGILRDKGFRQVPTLEEANLILINTCSVRDHAEQRVFGRLGELKRLKYRNPKLIIALCGCMAQRLGMEIEKKAIHVDIVVGPDGYRQLPDLVDQLDGNPTCHLTLSSEETYTDITPERDDALKAWVAIMRGCDNYCSYCIIPYVRGSARSRPVEDIVNEVQSLVRSEYKEVTLLGQNVNAYAHNGVDFAGLLKKLDAIEGLERIRFITSHPKDMTGEIIDAIADGNSICEHIHLPLQSGSTRILGSMNRHYTAEEYLNLVRIIRDTIPGVSITTDMIVGFPGETVEDYEKTLAMVEKIEFDSAFTFRYSPRPGTKASELQDDVPHNVKIERLERLIALQRSITDGKNKRLIGHEVEVLVEGESKKGRGQLVGRTRTDKTIVFDGDKTLVGSSILVRIDAAKGWTLWGHPIQNKV